jgi:hypothetical protein
MQCSVDIERNDEYLCTLLWSDFLDIVLSENSEVEKSIYGVLEFVFKNERISHNKISKMVTYIEREEPG